MKLPFPELNVQEQLAEFDIWVTASLGELRDTDRFKDEMAAVIGVFEALATATDDFAALESCTPDSIADTYVRLLQAEPTGIIARLQALASVLFLVTAKSDNNSKCQFPLYLRDHARWDSLPVVRLVGGRAVRSEEKVPRVLKAEKYMSYVAGLRDTPDEQRRLLVEFVRFILDGEAYVAQLWSLGRSYVTLRDLMPGKERDLLSPLVAFQVRGSVTASGGHDPETLLRDHLAEWGLTPDFDFNVSDVVIESASGEAVVLEVPEGQESEQVDAAQTEMRSESPAVPAPAPSTGSRRTGEKTRAYDFVLPFRVPEWPRRIFVQCQFYAGDSGSVSHKNVDQTRTSRAKVIELCKEPMFLEYVDGAGYFSSLNGDLKKLLQMDTTRSFFQVRSAAIRLRRELQAIGFLVPLEIEHAILTTDGTSEATVGALAEQGYGRTEIDRVITRSLATGIIQEQDGQFDLVATRREWARRYFVLDVAARRGRKLDRAKDRRGAAMVIVPGLGALWGLELNALAAGALQDAPRLRSEWSEPTIFPSDVSALCERGWMMLG